ncbi:MAG: hypothetical protein BWY82_00283 [Verrucomicrobia bacterium ADurb.Bin474]|nr:MAG: hypothetical protein BWY82_00283 [Verrucomicrobia bacterium ADurb.Bin474]
MAVEDHDRIFGKRFKQSACTKHARFTHIQWTVDEVEHGTACQILKHNQLHYWKTTTAFLFARLGIFLLIGVCVCKRHSCPVHGVYTPAPPQHLILIRQILTKLDQYCFEIRFIHALLLGRAIAACGSTQSIQSLLNACLLNLLQCCPATAAPENLAQCCPEHRHTGKCPVPLTRLLAKQMRVDHFTENSTQPLRLSLANRLDSFKLFLQARFRCSAK